MQIDDGGIETVQSPDVIDEFALIGEFGYERHIGPWDVSHGSTNWMIAIPTGKYELNRLTSKNVGQCAALVADGSIVSGGIVTEVYEPEGEGEIHVIVDEYKMGEPEITQYHITD